MFLLDADLYVLGVQHGIVLTGGIDDDFNLNQAFR